VHYTKEEGFTPSELDGAQASATR